MAKKVVKKVAPKKTVKKVAVKKVTKKKTVKKDLTAKQLMAKFVSDLKIAKKKQKTEVVVLTTKRSDYNVDVNEVHCVSHNDLKPNMNEFYRMLVCDYNVQTRVSDIEKMAITWFVKLN